MPRLDVVTTDETDRVLILARIFDNFDNEVGRYSIVKPNQQQVIPSLFFLVFFLVFSG